MNELENILKLINLPPLARRVYILLLQEKGLSASNLAQNLSVPRPSIYDQIKILKNKNFILERIIDGKKEFIANDPNIIKIQIEKEKEKIENANKDFLKILPHIQKINNSVKPKIQFFTGLDGIKSVQDDILWHKNIETYTLWPTEKMIKLLGDEYLMWHNKRRKEEKISVKVIRQSKILSEKKHPYLKSGEEFLREVKYLKSKNEIQMSYWIYGDKVAFFDSSAELYAFIVHSRSFANLMKVQFDFLWGNLS